MKRNPPERLLAVGFPASAMITLDSRSRIGVRDKFRGNDKVARVEKMQARVEKRWHKFMERAGFKAK